MNVLGKPSCNDICGFVTTTAYERLKIENEKLRELVKDAIEAASLDDVYD